MSDSKNVARDSANDVTPVAALAVEQRSFISRLFRKLLPLALVAIGGLFMLSLSGRVPTNIGHIDGRFAECPESPNCVSTQARQADKQMPPIQFSGGGEETTKKLKSTIAEKFPRAKLICEKENYLHYEFVSLVFRFVDDVEFLVNDDTKQIDFRSASRVGHSDLGANRKRMKIISTEMQR